MLTAYQSQEQQGNRAFFLLAIWTVVSSSQNKQVFIWTSEWVFITHLHGGREIGPQQRLLGVSLKLFLIWKCCFAKMTISLDGVSGETGERNQCKSLRTRTVTWNSKDTAIQEQIQCSAQQAAHHQAIQQLLPSPNTYCVAHTKCSFRLNVGNAADPEQGTCLIQRPFCFLLWSSGKIHFLWQHKHDHWWCSGKFSKTKQFIPSFSPVPSQMWVKSFFTRQTFCYGNTHLWQSKTEHFFNKNGISVSLRKGRTFIWLLSASVAVQGKEH